MWQDYEACKGVMAAPRSRGGDMVISAQKVLF